MHYRQNVRGMGGLIALLGLVVPMALAGNQSTDPLDSYGDPLPPGAVLRIGTARLHEGLPIRSLAFTPDGRRLASAASGWVHVWEVPGGRLLGQYPALMLRPQARFSPDGGTLAVLDAPSAGAGMPVPSWESAVGSIHLYDLASGKETRVLPANDVVAFSFGAGGRLLLAGTASGELIVYEASTGTVIATLKDPVPGRNRIVGVARVALSPDGETAAVVYSNGFGDRLQIWDVKPQTERFQDTKLAGGCLALGFTPDSRTLLTLHDPRVVLPLDVGTRVEAGPNCVRAWDVTPGKVVPVPTPGQIQDLGVSRVRPAGVFSPDGKRYVLMFPSGGETSDHPHAEADFETQLGDVAGGPGKPLGGKTHSIYAAAFSSDGKTLATGGSDGVVNLWDVDAAKPLAGSRGAGGAMNAVAASPDGRVAATGGDDGVIRLYDLSTGKLSRELEGHEDTIVGLAFSSAGATLASSSRDHSLRLWDLAGDQAPVELLLDRDAAMNRSSIAWSADDKYIGLTADSSLSVWDVLARRPVAAGDAAAGSAVRDFPQAAELAGKLCFNATGQVNAPDPTRRGLALLIDAHLGQVGGVTPLGAWSCAAVGPRGKLVAVAKADSLRLFDGTNLQEVARLSPKAESEPERPIKWFRHLMFTPDGARLLAVQDSSPWAGNRGNPDDPNLNGQPDQVVRVWDVASVREVQQFHARNDGAIQGLALARGGKLLLTASRDGTVVAWDLTSPALASAPADLPADAGRLWELVLGSDAETAADAENALAARPADAVAEANEFFRKVPANAEVAGLVSQLRSADFAVGLAAVGKLSQIRQSQPDVEPMLVRELLKPDLDSEPRRRILDLLAGMGGRQTAELSRLGRVVRLLERTGTPDAKHVLQHLATVLPPNYGGNIAAAAILRLGTGTTTRPSGPMTRPMGSHDHSTAGPNASTDGARSAPTTTFGGEVPSSGVVPMSVPTTFPALQAPTTEAADPTPLPPQALARLGSTFLHQGGPVLSLSFSADGKRLASNGADGTARVWDLEAHKELIRFAATRRSGAAALSPDGKWLATIDPGETDRTTNRPLNRLVEWNVETGARLWDATVADAPFVQFTSVAFSPDGKTVAAGALDFTIHLLDAATGAAQATLDPLPNEPLDKRATAKDRLGAVRGIVFSSDGGKLLAFHRGKFEPMGPDAVSLWDMKTRSPILVSKPVHQPHDQINNYEPLGAGLMPSGKLAFLHRGPEPISQFFDAPSSDVLDLSKHYAADAQQILMLALSPDGNSVLIEDQRSVTRPSPGLSSGEWPVTLTLQNTATGATVQRFPPIAGIPGGQVFEDMDTVSVAAFSPDGRQLAVARCSSAIYLFDVESGQPVGAPPASRVDALAQSANGQILAAGGADATVTLWDMRDAAAAKPLLKFSPSPYGVRALAFSPEDKRLAVATEDGSLFFCNAATGRAVQHYTPANPDSSLLLGRRAFSRLAWSVDGRLVAGCGNPGYLCDAATGKLTNPSFEIPQPDRCTDIRFPDRKQLLVLGQSHFLRIDPTTVVDYNATHLPNVTHGGMALSYDGKLFAYTHWSPNGECGADIIDCTTQTQKSSLVSRKSVVRGDRPEEAVIKSAAFSPDGHYFALAEDAVPKHLRGSDAEPIRDPKQFAAIIHVWDLNSGQEEQTLTGHDGPVREMLFSPDGARLFTASDDGTVLVWNGAPVRP